MRPRLDALSVSLEKQGTELVGATWTPISAAVIPGADVVIAVIAANKMYYTQRTEVIGSIVAGSGSRWMVENVALLLLLLLIHPGDEDLAR